MTTVLATIGAVVIVLGAATKIPLAAAALIRACIPVVTAISDFHDALYRQRRTRTAIHRSRECRNGTTIQYRGCYCRPANIAPAPDVSLKGHQTQPAPGVERSP
jgi:hypothetical protein